MSSGRTFSLFRFFGFKSWLIALAFMLSLLSEGKANDGNVIWRHAISLTGEPKYPINFKHPDYVNPSAPKGGRLRLGALGTFDNFNPFISGIKGNLASHIFMLNESLLTQSLDEQTTEYGLLAEAIAYPADYSWAAFRLRPEARWHDGKSVTAEDVIFSFNAWKRLSPQWNRTYLKVASVEKISELEVRFTMAEPGDAALPLYLGQMSILPKHWWEGVNAEGKPRDINMTSLEPPLGSGPYKLDTFVPGRSISYTRVADYWGAKSPMRVGTENFDRYEIEYFRDPNVLFEAFKADLIDFRREQSLKTWVVGYDNPAVQAGRIAKETFGIERLGIVKAFVFNQRRTKLQDVKLREALALAYHFDDANRSIFHAMLSRPASYFPNTDFAAAGAVSDRERHLASTLPGVIPERVFVTLQDAPPTPIRARLFQALKLLNEMGYTLKGSKLVDAQGEQFSVEFLLQDAAMENVVSLYAENLQKLGIATPIRIVDDVQYQNRLRTFDYDIVVHAWVQGHAPGAEVREYFSSSSADARGTNNVAGLKSPVIDALVEKLVLSPTREEKVTAGRLLDRILRASHFAVPLSTEDREFIAVWNRFSRPAAMPRYGGASFPTIWWWDAERAAKTEGRKP